MASPSSALAAGASHQDQPGAVAAFHRAAARVPAYREALAKRGVDAKAVTDLESFARLVPVVDKQTLFADRPVAELCVDGELTDAATLYTSSGHSGVFSFGVETAAQSAGLAARVDGLLDFAFGIRATPTLLINALPAGVRVPTEAATLIDTSTRPNAVLAAIRQAGPSFGQGVIVGEYPLLKEVLDRGQAAGLDWGAWPVQLVTGGEVMPENFRRYAQGVLGGGPGPGAGGEPGGDFGGGGILLSLGISELALTLGIETLEARQIRQSAHTDAAVARAIFGLAGFAPTLIRYDPDAMHVETPSDANGRPTLVVTTLDLLRKLPLIRYGVGDWAEAIPAAEMDRRLVAAGLEPVGGDQPFLAMWGRGRSVAVGGKPIYPEQVKEQLYADPAIARRLTGAFRLGGGDRLAVRAQLSERATGADRPTIEAGWRDRLTAALGVAIDVEAWEHRAYAQAFDSSYQAKFQYL